MILTVYHKKAFVLKIPFHPPFPKGDYKDNSHIFMRFLPTHFHDEPYFFCALDSARCLMSQSLIDSTSEFPSHFFMDDTKSQFLKPNPEAA
jgi:hypothetical protein